MTTSTAPATTAALPFILQPDEDFSFAMPDDREERELTIPEPPPGTPGEVAKRAWQVAWGASNAVASYHASVLHHMVEHEERMRSVLLEELTKLRQEVSRDLSSFKRTMLSSLAAVGIRIDVSPSGEHAAIQLHGSGGAPALRERVASSHDIEEGFDEVGAKIEERFDAIARELRGGASSPSTTPSDRVREMLSQERARIEAEQQIMRLELEKKQMELAHAQEIKRLGDQKTELAEANSRWLRIALLVAGGVVTILAALFIWAVTKQPPSIGGP